jgi:hypothetical protein
MIQARNWIRPSTQIRVAGLARAFLARSVSEGDHDGSLTPQQRGHQEPLYASASRSFRARVGCWSPSLTLRARKRKFARRANILTGSSTKLDSPVNPNEWWHPASEFVDQNSLKMGKSDATDKTKQAHSVCRPQNDASFPLRHTECAYYYKHCRSRSEKRHGTYRN